MTKSLTHLDRLEAEAIHIMREVVAEAERPVMLYSIGKDSAVMLHLAKKAFYPAPPPFPLLHVDTTWKFQDMYALREKAAQAAGMDLLVWQNPAAQERGINPFDHGPLHTDMWKTEGLKQALTKYNFDVAFGGAAAEVLAVDAADGELVVRANLAATLTDLLGFAVVLVGVALATGRVGRRVRV